MKRCNKCGEQKSLKGFYKNSNSCKECRKIYAKKHREKNIEKIREYERKRARLPHRVEARKAYAKTPEGIAAGNKAKYKYTKQNPVKRGASHIVNNAVRDGKLEKPDICSKCGAGGRIHGHHNDYAKPLKVRWLCSTCHRAWHKKYGEAKNAG